MTRHTAALGLLLALAACDLDFVAVDGQQIISAHVSSEHDDEGLMAEIYVRWIHAGDASAVRAQGTPIEVEAVAAGIRDFRATVSVDSLAPVVVLAFEAEGDSLRLVVPLLARRGRAYWNGGGDLVLPIEIGDAGLDRFSWQVELMNESDRALLRIAGEGRPRLPFSLPGALVPDSVSLAAIRLNGSDRLEHMLPSVPLTWSVSVSSRAVVSVPARDLQAALR